MSASRRELCRVNWLLEMRPVIVSERVLRPQEQRVGDPAPLQSLVIQTMKDVPNIPCIRNSTNRVTPTSPILFHCLRKPLTCQRSGNGGQLRVDYQDTCLVLDVRLPGQSGLDFQRDLAAASVTLPIVFITGHGDIPMTVQAMKAGAIEFLTKPFRDQDLLDAVNVGLACDRARRENAETLSALRARFEVLTPRERAILVQVVQGRLNKQIAGEMGITETTVKVHRSNMMRKIEANSVAELCRMVDQLKLLPENSKPS